MSEKRLIDWNEFKRHCPDSICCPHYENGPCLSKTCKYWQALPVPTLADVCGTRTLDSMTGETDKILEDLLGLRTAFPTIDILTRLTEAGDVLLHRYDYDAHGWEVLHYCIEDAKKRIEAFRQAHKYLVEKGFNVFGVGT